MADMIYHFTIISFSHPQRVRSHTMGTPAESDVKTQPMDDATKPKTHHAESTHAENGTKKPLVRLDPGKGLENSPLSKLPPELRTMILEMTLFSPMGITIPARSVRDGLNMRFGRECYNGYVFFAPTDPHRTMYKNVCTNTSWVIDLMTMCGEIRSETKKVLSSYDINVQGVDLDKIGGQHGTSRTAPLIRSVSSFLGKSSGRVVLWENWIGHHFSVYKEQLRQGLPPAPRVFSLDNSLATYAQAGEPLQVSIGLSMTFHEVSGARDVYLCKQDTPVTGFDCRRIKCIVPLGDRVNASKMVDEAVDRRLDLLRSHFPHRWCYVRAMRSKLESGLALARQYMREEVDRIC